MVLGCSSLPLLAGQALWQGFCRSHLFHGVAPWQFWCDCNWGFVTAVSVIICLVNKMKGTECWQFGGMKTDLITATKSLTSPVHWNTSRLHELPFNRAAYHASKQTSREDRGEIVCQGCVFAREEQQYLQEGLRWNPTSKARGCQHI